MRAAPSTADLSPIFIPDKLADNQSWPTSEATRSVAKSKSSHGIWSFDPACRRRSWGRSRVKRSHSSSGRNEQMTNVFHFETVAVDEMMDRLIIKTGLTNIRDCLLQSLLSAVSPLTDPPNGQKRLQLQLILQSTVNKVYSVFLTDQT